MGPVTVTVGILVAPNSVLGLAKDCDEAGVSLAVLPGLVEEVS